MTSSQVSEYRFMKGEGAVTSSDRVHAERDESMATMDVQSQDSGSERVSQRTVRAVEVSVRLLRGCAETVLIKWGLADRVDDVQVVVSELATNAIRARLGPPGRITLRITLLPDHGLILVEMTDPFPGRPEWQEAADLDESGRGLGIVRLLAEDCGYRDEADDGKTVWATLRMEE